MDTTPALIVSHEQLQTMLRETAQEAAQSAVTQLKSELNTDPDERVTQELRTYLTTPASLPTPRDHWANGLHIRMIEHGNLGKPKSVAWFHKFKIKSGLRECFHRRSKRHGHLQEWCFEDIRLCWRTYYGER